MTSPVGDLERQFAALWDRVEPLIPRAWGEVATRLANEPPSPGSVEDMRCKALAGHLEHGGDVLSWCREDFDREQRHEMTDLVVYRALELALLGAH